MGLLLRAVVGVSVVFLLTAGGAAGVQDAPPLDERTIYIPYKELEKVFEAEGRGVFLPYPQFLQLWEGARAGAASSKPPVEAITAAGHYEGEVVGEVAKFSAAFSFEVLKEGWTEIPLALGGLALSEAEADGKGAILRAGGEGYRLVVPDRGRYGLDVKFGLKVVEKAGYRSISFNTPRAAVSKLKVTLPGKDLEVTLEPNLAATTKEVGDGTELLAFLGASNRIQITWRPRARLMAPGEALISADATQRVTVDEGVVQATAAYSLNVLRTRVPGFALEFPGGYKVTALEGADVREWSVRDDGKLRVAEVSLNRGVEGKYALTLSIEKVDTGFPGDGATLEVPRIALRGARRERGSLAISLGPDLRAKISERSGATQVDVADLGKGAAGAAFGFRYPQHPFAVKLDVEKVQPRVRAEALAIVSVSDERIDLGARYRFRIQRGGLFRLRFLLPEGYEVVDVESPSQIRDQRVLPTDDGPLLEVDLPQRTTGGVEVSLRLERRRKGAEGAVSLPFLQALDVVQETGSVGVSIQESLKAVTGKVDGLVPKDIREIAQGGIGWPRDQVLTLGFSFQKHPLSAALDISRRESQVTAQVQTTLDAEEDLIKVKSRILYDVRYAGVDRFRFTLPKETGEGAHIEGSHVKEKRTEGVEVEEGEEEQIAWVVTLQRKVLGAYLLTVEYDLKLEKAETGKAVSMGIPELEVQDVFTEEGFIAARKAPNVVLQAGERSDSLTLKDPRELPESMGAGGAFLAYQYLRHPVELEVKVTRYEFSKPIPTVVSHLHTESVLTMEGAIRSDSTLSVLNKQRQFLRVRLPASAKVLGVSVDGQKKRWAGGGEEEVIQIDLAEGGKQGEEILIRIQYDLPRTSPGGLAPVGRHVVRVPVIEGDPGEEDPPPVAQLSLNLHVPSDRVYLGFSTTMSRLTPPSSIWERIKRFLFGRAGASGGGREVISAGEKLAGRAAGGKAGEMRDLVRAGKKVSFFKLEGGGVVAVTHISRPLHAALDMAILVGLLAAGVILPRRKVIPATLAVFGLGGVTVVFLAFAPDALRPYLNTALLAALLLGLIWAGLFAVTEWRRGPRGSGPMETVPPMPGSPAVGTEGPEGGPSTLDLSGKPPPEEPPRKRRGTGRSSRSRKSKGEDE